MLPTYDQYKERRERERDGWSEGGRERLELTNDVGVSPYQ
jgi:hypothetical protein